MINKIGILVACILFIFMGVLIGWKEYGLAFVEFILAISNLIVAGVFERETK